MSHDEMLKLFMRVIIRHINLKYIFASVLMDVDESTGRFDIICQTNPHFLFIINKSQILGLSRYVDMSSSESISKLLDADNRPELLNRQIEKCVDNCWLNMIRRNYKPFT